MQGTKEEASCFHYVVCWPNRIRRLPFNSQWMSRRQPCIDQSHFPEDLGWANVRVISCFNLCNEQTRQWCHIPEAQPKFNCWWLGAIYRWWSFFCLTVCTWEHSWGLKICRLINWNPTACLLLKQHSPGLTIYVEFTLITKKCHRRFRTSFTSKFTHFYQR